MLRLILIVLAVAVIAGGAFWFFTRDTEREPVDPRIQECVEGGGTWDDTAETCVTEEDLEAKRMQELQQVADEQTRDVLSRMDEIAIIVPDMDGVSAVMSEESGNPESNYPMGSFESDDGVVRGTVVAIDDNIVFVDRGHFMMPFAVNSGGSGSFVYMGLFTYNAETIEHTDSEPVGDRVEIESVELALDREGIVNVFYLEHGPDQALSEEPEQEAQLQMTVRGDEITQSAQVAVNFEGEEGDSDISLSCEEAGGTWLPEHGECEYVNPEWCSDNGGEFAECESACRHDDEEGMCTLQCVPVCSNLF